MRFFFDNCISVNLAEAMRLLNEPHHEIEHLTKRFSSGALDVEWIPVVAADPEIVRGTGYLLPLKGSRKGPKLIYRPFTDGE